MKSAAARLLTEYKITEHIYFSEKYIAFLIVTKAVVPMLKSENSIELADLRTVFNGLYQKFERFLIQRVTISLQCLWSMKGLTNWQSEVGDYLRQQ